MTDKIDRMKALLLEKLPRDQYLKTGIEGLSLVRRDKPYAPKPFIYNPEVILLAQGKKNVYFGDRIYTYDERNYFVLTVPLPVRCEAIIEDGKPMLGMVLQIAPKMIGEILYEMEIDPPKKASLNDSIYQAAMSDEILDAAIRLLNALNSKNDTRVLGPVYLKEILYKILNGEHGEVLMELAYNNRNLYQISRAVNKIYEDYSAPVDIRTLAREAGMSTATFHSNFKTITNTSPLQYIKNIRLHKAKELIQQEGEKAYEAAIKVGYESPSQFNREYKRLFGVTPAKDRMEGAAAQAI